MFKETEWMADGNETARSVFICWKIEETKSHSFSMKRKKDAELLRGDAQAFINDCFGMHFDAINKQ